MAVMTMKPCASVNCKLYLDSHNARSQNFYPHATVHLGDSEGDLAYPVDPLAPSPLTSLGVTV
jgi:hypothetical protein